MSNSQDIRKVRTFRIFVSSTFSDLKEERNALQRYVFPRLRELCLQHGCRFQAIDLRWGVREEAALDQQTMRICLDEIRRSQRASPRPNFIILLGDRYGWRPLPAEIPADEFEAIEEHTVDPIGKELLARWYKRDDNAQYRRVADEKPQPVFCLQPRQERFVDYLVWEREVEMPLRRLLLAALENTAWTPEARLKYQASATEQEIAIGALGIPEAAAHVFGFFRSIKDLPQDESAKDFADLDETWKPDAEAAARLRNLKSRLEQQLPGNIRHYDAAWTGTGASGAHIGTLPEKLEDCLKLLDTANDPPTLCTDVWRRLARVMLDEMTRLEQVEPLEKEIADHADFGNDRVRSFIGRTDVLRAILDYVRGEDNHPLCVFGESGSGKSALMARAIAECGMRLNDAWIASRFIGATPVSSDGRALLESLCRQIARRYGAEEAMIPTDYRELVKDFRSRLALAGQQNRLIIFLDALDQLSDADHARNLIWLPVELPEHVRLIVSALPGECLTALGRKLPTANIIELEPMPKADGQRLLNLWLSEAGRTLQSGQANEVLAKFAQNGLPLYLKLAFEESRLWKSYSPAVNLALDIPGVIRQLFARLSMDANHGPVVVSQSLGYLAAAKNGLSEDELLDVLSQDETVFSDFKSRARHTPPDRRLPVIVWSRLYFDLEPYLTERSADGASLMSFYHRQLREVVEAEFLAGGDKRERHGALARYFANQELFEPQKKTPNVRKLSELPYQQTHGEQWDQLYSTLTDLEFLEAKCTHVAVTITGGKAKTVYGGVYELQEDYRRALERFPME